MHKFILLSVVLLLVLPCSAQLCAVDTAQPDDAFAYMQSEVRTLTVIREAINLSAKMTVPTSPNPNHVQTMAEYNRTMNNIDERYACAAKLLQHYKPSTNENIQNSVDNLLTAIQVNQQVNKMLRGMTEQLNKENQGQEPRPDNTAETLADIKSTQQAIFKMMLGCVKQSTLLIVSGEGGDEDWKPTAFTITRTQHDALLRDVRSLAEAKTEHTNLVDLCAEVLLETLNETLPVRGEVAGQ